jgi:hypothetical protein
MVTNKVPKGSDKFHCEPCDYISCRKSQYDRHLLTRKHKNVVNVTECYEFGSESSAGLCCQNCNKQYKSRMGLWHHVKTCISVTPDQENSETKRKNSQIINEDYENTMGEPKLPFELNPGMFIELIQQNKELQNLLLQQAKSHSEIVNKLIEREPVSSNINSNNTINNNQKFNLNFFLNETCKDAISIQEFIENIRITFEDLITIGNSGFVNGVSDILIKQLKDLEVNKRPIHCTDSKRETIYLKEVDAWNKDDKDKTKLKQLIEKIEYKNVAALHNWCNENPDSKVNNTPNNLLKDKIFFQTLQGDERTRDKIIKNVSKEVIVEKE